MYESKFNRSTSCAKFLHPDVNIKQLYLKYKEKCSEISEVKKTVPLPFFTKVLKNEFNLKFFKIQKKICRKCEHIDSDLKKIVISANRRVELIEEKDEHLNLVRNSIQ